MKTSNLSNVNFVKFECGFEHVTFFTSIYDLNKLQQTGTEGAVKILKWNDNAVNCLSFLHELNMSKRGRLKSVYFKNL